MQEALERGHAVGYRGVGRGHEDGVAGAAPADPVLRAAELAGILAAAPPVCEEHTVDLADQAVREREALTQPGEPMVQGRDVVRDLDHLVERHTRCFVQLEEQEVRERRLRPLDLRGEHRLLADVGVEEEGLSGSSVETPSSRPTASTAASRERSSPPSKARGGAGGRGVGMKARTDSPPPVVFSYLPDSPRLIPEDPCAQQS
jgi:hypothetical protein